MSNALERWFETRNRNPMRDLSRMEDAFERSLNSQLECPSCDVVEDNKNYTLKFDLPGVQKDQVKVEVSDDQLTIKAERQEEHTTKGKKKYVSEISYGTYLRTFRLPAPVDEKKVEAKFDNGVLTITVPKTEIPAAKSKQIKIQ